MCCNDSQGIVPLFDPLFVYGMNGRVVDSLVLSSLP